MKPCVYVTSGWGVHDQRWVAALVDQGFQPTIIRFGIDVHDADALSTAVTNAATSNIPVLAGPLDTITKSLIGIEAPLIGLSWGFDLHDMTDPQWLTDLDGIIVDSSATAELAQAAGLNPNRITYLPWGVDLELFQAEGPAQEFADFNIPVDARIVLSLRAHEPRYRVADILDGFAQACESMADIHLVIGHTGSLTKDLRSHAYDLGISERTHFIGSVPEDHIPALLRGADVYVSASEVDGTSVTMLQAMACGAPVVLSNTAGNRAWVEPGTTGSLFNTADPADLAKQLQHLLSTDADQRDAMTKRARALVFQQADWNKNVARLQSALAMAGCTSDD